MIDSVSHVALRVPDVSEAEHYFCDLFEMEVAFRDLTVEGVQQSLRPGVTWEQAAEHGHKPGLSSLWNGRFNLALEQATADGKGHLDHVGLHVDAAEVASVAQRVRELGCPIRAERADILVFDDHYGTRWELTATQYANPADQSTGARLGAWLDLS